MKIDIKELAFRESERIEWKENVADVHDIVKTAVAFANDYSNLGGGYIVCGAKEYKDEHGFQAVDFVGLASARLKEIEGQFLQHCREKVSPPIVPMVEEITTESEGRRILVFIVPSSDGAHAYRQDGTKYFIRIGRETREARDGLLRELLVKKGQMEHWDRRGNARASIKDIDLITLRDSLQQMNLWDPKKSLEDYLSTTEPLSNFVPPLISRKAIENQLHPRNFALLLFGSDLLKYCAGAYVIFSVYRGKDRSEQTAERLEITGTIVEQAKKVIQRLNTEAYTAFDKDSPNPNQVKYPVRALQEAVVNALVHRDYEMDQPVRVTVFSDRVEIISPGALPRTIDVERFKKGYSAPFWRNQSLGYFFNKLQLAQGEGQGIPTILRLMKEEGCPAPSFEIEEERVCCILPAHPRHALMRELNEIENKIIIGNVSSALESLERLLDSDPYNYRMVELYCEVNNVLATPRRIYEFIIQRQLNLQLFSSSTLLLMSELLMQVRDDGAVSLMAQDLNTRALNDRLEESEIKRVIINLRKMKQDDKAIEVVESVFTRNPALKNNSALRELSAKARMDLAKKCMETGRDKSRPTNIKARAWELCREYLQKAELDLKIALDFVTNEIDRDYIERDTEFLRHLQQISKKPEQVRTVAGYSKPDRRQQPTFSRANRKKPSK
jgi:predicted HTH transcriptional regulator